MNPELQLPFMNDLQSFLIFRILGEPGNPMGNSHRYPNLQDICGQVAFRCLGNYETGVAQFPSTLFGALPMAFLLEGRRRSQRSLMTTL